MDHLMDEEVNMLKDRTIEKARIGDTIEYRAIVWLLDQKYEVFRNVSSIGPIDMITISPEGKIFKLDIKKCSSAERNDSKLNFNKPTDEQKDLGVLCLYYDEVLDHFAMSIEDIYQNRGRPYKKAVSLKIKKEEIQLKFDKEFASIPEAARYYDLNVRTVREWIRRNPGMSLEQAINKTINRTKRVIVFGKMFSNRVEACRFYNVNSHSVEERMRTKDDTLEQSLSHFIERNKRRQEEK